MATNMVASDLDLNNLSDDDIVTTVPEEEVEEEIKEALEPKVEEPEEPKVSEKEEKDIDVLIESLQKEIENTNGRYEKSSAEGKRLYQVTLDQQKQLAEFDEVKPVLDILANNKELQEIAKQMIQGTWNSVPDERIDLDDAVRDPNSASAKTLKALVQREAQELLAKSAPKQDSAKNEKYEAIGREIETVQKTMKLEDSEVKDIIDFSKNLSFEHIAKLYKLEHGKQKETPNMSKLLDEIRQLSKTSTIPSNLKGGGVVEETEADRVAKWIREAGGENNINDLIPT